MIKSEVIMSQLEIFPWDDNFATGIDEIDRQHRRLVELLNKLVMHLAFNSEVPALNEVFHELRQYAALHFETEERIWHEHFNDDPWELWHKESHADFGTQVLEIKQRESEASIDDTIREVVRFLTHWLALHIIESDKRMAKVVLALPSGISLEHAKEQANHEMAGATRILISTVMGMYDNLANRTIELTREIGRRLRAESELRSTQEELLRLKNAAVEASLAKSAFLANMSHEIRTPMSGVIGMIDLLLKTTLTTEQRKMAHIIQESSLVQLGILDDILDFSKIEAGKMSLSIEPFNLRELVRGVCSNLDVQSRQKFVALSHQIESDVPIMLEGDRLRVHRVLSNFISNAIKFSSGLTRAGEVLVAVKTVRESDGQLWLDFSVCDNGIGIDVETQHRLFHPFIQGDSSTTRKYGGTGLGLVISMHLVEAMGGELRMESTPDVGSTFTARLPFKRVEPLRPAAATADPPAEVLLASHVPSREEAMRLRALVLVAEDDETNQEVIRQQLALLGYLCDVVADGREALARWQSGDYGLVLTDIHMPQMDGYQLAKAIRQEEASRGQGHTPLLALTASVLSGEAERCREAGVDDCLAKPVPFAELKAKLFEHLPSPASAEVPPLDIMVLDDDPFMLEMMTYLLEKIGQPKVSSFTSGQAALASLDRTEKHPAAILLDINMPGMDGIEVVYQLALRHYAGGVIPISGEDELTLRTTAKLAQENELFVPGSIKKPPLPQLVIDLLRQCYVHSIDEHSIDEHRFQKRRPSKSYDTEVIRRAILSGEMVNYYQPKVHAHSGNWVGVECLVRWKHPQDGLVFPDQFIPQAEVEGLIGELTRTVLKGAICQARLWREEGLKLLVAVNVSMDDLSDTAFADFVIEQVGLFDVPPQSIILEITEGRLMKDFTTALHVLSRLRLKRFRLSIDDFGTGHSSLAKLRDLPFDELKIDKGFTHHAGSDDRLRAIFEGSLAMARQLHMEVVAEGVEDESDWKFLRSVDCDLAQGYFISPPLPAAQLPAWHKKWQQRSRLH